MGECKICGNEGSRVQVNHKKLGRIMVCQDCWIDIYQKGERICEGTSSSSDSSGCPACGF